MGSRAQAWSLDLIVAVVVFMLAVGIFYFFANNKTGNDQSKLQIESQLVANKLTTDEQLAITNGTTVDETKLVEVSSIPYVGLKERVGLAGDFCAILVDQNGSIILVGNNNSDQRVGFGSPDLKINLSNGNVYSCGDSYT